MKREKIVFIESKIEKVSRARCAGFSVKLISYIVHTEKNQIKYEKEQGEKTIIGAFIYVITPYVHIHTGITQDLSLLIKSSTFTRSY
jgi:hypothetical protein